MLYQKKHIALIPVDINKLPGPGQTKLYPKDTKEIPTPYELKQLMDSGSWPCLKLSDGHIMIAFIIDPGEQYSFGCYAMDGASASQIRVSYTDITADNFKVIRRT